MSKPSVTARTEVDFLGTIEIPRDCLYGINTAQRTGELCDFASCPWRRAGLVRALARVKMAAAMANREIGAMPPDIADAIVTACDRDRHGQAQRVFRDRYARRVRRHVDQHERQ